MLCTYAIPCTVYVEANSPEEALAIAKRLTPPLTSFVSDFDEDQRFDALLDVSVTDDAQPMLYDADDLA